MKTFLFVSLASVLVASFNIAWAQTSGAAEVTKESAKGATETAKENKKNDFASQEKSMREDAARAALRSDQLRLMAWLPSEDKTADARSPFDPAA